MMNPQIGKIGVTSEYKVNGGRIAEDKNLPYACPFQVKYAGLLMDLKPAKSYDGDAGDYLVAVPCAAGKAPKGWSFKTSARTDLLIGASLQFYPIDSQLTGGGGTYATDENNFFPCTVVPMKVGALTGVPVASNTNIAINAEITSAADGTATTATSGDVVIGIAELPANNTGKAAGATFVKVRFVAPYTKA